MEPTDLTVSILREIRDEMRGAREEQAAFRAESREFQQQASARFEVIELALRDLAQQLVILGRGVKVAIDRRSAAEERLDEHEKRIADLEKRVAT